MRRSSVGIVLVAVLAGCGGGSSSKPVAHVGGTAITRGQLERTLDHFREEAQAEGRPFPKEGSAAFGAAERQALRLLVYREELRQAAARLGVPVTDDEVERRAKASGGEADSVEGRAFAEASIRAQLAYEHVYRKVTAGLPAARRQAAIDRFARRLKRDAKVSYEAGYGAPPRT